MKAFNDKDEEIDVFSAEEHTAAVAAEVEKARKEEEAKWTPKVSALETELTGAKTALGDRAKEFGHFRELHADVVEKLGVAERVIYDNQKAAHDREVKQEEEAKTRHEASVDAAIRATAGTDEKLFTKMKSMWNVIGINAVTPEEIETKKKMILGAIGSTEPDLVASVAGFSGGYKPPVAEKKEGETFADTPAGQGLANSLGLKLKADEKK